jgi:predicted peroxiredoxin
MTRYVLIESRDPFESRDADFIDNIAMAVKERGHDVTVFLVQNGVLAARKTVHRLERVVDAGVTLLADNFSLRERGIRSDELSAGIQESGIEVLIGKLLEENVKTFWH